MVEIPTVVLNNEVRVPQLGFGVYRISPGDTAAVVEQAVRAGYRHIDTAQMYGNEAEVAEGIRRAGVSAEDVFVTSKLITGHHRYDDVLRAFDGTLRRMRRDRLDMFLIHWPLPGVADYTDTWRALEHLYADGRVRAIGVSNFTTAHLDTLLRGATVVPAVNQVELHPYLAQAEIRGYGKARGIATEAWSPLAQGRVATDAVIADLARAHGRTPAQIALRWHIQLGTIVIPKTIDPTRMRQNLEIFDFHLTDSDMESLTALDHGERLGPEPDQMNVEVTEPITR